MLQRWFSWVTWYHSTYICKRWAWQHSNTSSIKRTKYNTNLKYSLKSIKSMTTMIRHQHHLLRRNLKFQWQMMAKSWMILWTSTSNSKWSTFLKRNPKKSQMEIKDRLYNLTSSKNQMNIYHKYLPSGKDSLTCSNARDKTINYIWHLQLMKLNSDSLSTRTSRLF